MQNPLVAIQQFGQSIWYDYISRHLLTSGELQRLITQDGIRGVTSNPAIFEKAITSSTDYDDTLVTLLQERDRDAHSLYEHLAIQDIQMAADLMAPVYQQTNRRDGYVCLEVSPHLADDTTATIEEARRLWRTIARPNAMIKVPATPAGLPAIQQLISEGINVNVTLLFSISMYEAVANAYINGIEALIAHGGDPRRVASVASFFVSRIDTAVDQRITARLQQVTSPEEKNLLTSLLGQAAVASARLAYQKYTTLYHTPRWQALAAQGAQTQRLLWASTSTKNPDYPDVKYVEELIGPETINTIPTATLEAFRDHGHPQARLTTRLEEAGQIMERLEQAGISMQEVTDTLLVQGVRLFADAFDQLLGAIEQKRRALLGAKLNGQSFSLPADFQASVDTLLEEWRTRGKVRKLWARDASLWTGTDENHWLGWLDVVTEQGHRIDHLQKIGEEVKREGFSHALLLGMGGSSLCPEVLSLTFGPQPGYPVLRVLDSTDPDQIERIEQGIDLTKTLFIVSSKSGTTLETSLLERYFFARVQEKVGPERAGKQFIAITDPGSPLQKRAEEKGFRAVCPGRPDIGGRYSALSDFGMVPAALMGMDVSRLLSATEHMVHSCAAAVPPATNPGVVLGAILGLAAQQGREKITLVTSPALRSFGAWLEQLLAESTGKEGKALIPVDQEQLTSPDRYGNDRLFVSLHLQGDTDEAQDRALAALEAAGHPVVRITLSDPYHLGQEMFRWEMATAVAGAIMGINPFDQPDVEATKTATRRLLSPDTPDRPSEAEPLWEEQGCRLFADPHNAAILSRAVEDNPSLARYLKAHLDRLTPGDYFALLAYIEMDDTCHRVLQAIRHAVRDAYRVATCLGYGPRYLHSTGQAHKGGPNSGLFLLITADDATDIPIPALPYTFGQVKAAQAQGDCQVLAERHRRLLRLHLSGDIVSRLKVLQQVITDAWEGTSK